MLEERGGDRGLGLRGGAFYPAGAGTAYALKIKVLATPAPGLVGYGLRWRARLTPPLKLRRDKMVVKKTRS